MKTRFLPNLEQITVLQLDQLRRSGSTKPYNYTATTATINTFPLPLGREQPGYIVVDEFNGTLPYGQSNYGNNIGVCRSLNGGNFDGPAWWLGATSEPRPGSVRS